MLYSTRNFNARWLCKAE